MKKVVILLMSLLIISTVVSAEIIIKEQPKKLYNLGDLINIPIKLTTTTEINEFFLVDLICNGLETEMHKEYITLSSGQEKEISFSIPLMSGFIGKTTGICKIKTILGEEYALTNNFKISDLIILKIQSEKTHFNPGEQIIIEGEAKKENGAFVNGFIEANITTNNISHNIELIDTIKKGYFSINYTLPLNMKAGEYVVKLTSYEKDSVENITNRGIAAYNIVVSQIPTTLEVSFKERDIFPGSEISAEAILYDQTHEKIESTAIITIKNHKGKILEQVEKSTGEFFTFPIPYNTPPSNWTIVAVSNKLTTQATFTILEKEDILIEIENNTLFISNKGNIPYNKTLLVKIGNQTINLNLSLDVDETSEYLLTAPEGKYNIEITADGKSTIAEGIVLTGNIIGIKKSGNILTVVRHPMSWIFIIMIIGLFAFMLFKKDGYKRILFGIKTRKKSKLQNLKLLKNKGSSKSQYIIKNRAELSLSIQGRKQDATGVYLKINYPEEILFDSKKQEPSNYIKNTLQKIIKLAESKKAFVYENNGDFFFIFAPVITKTFKNEESALKLAQEINEFLKKYNKLAKNKINFGICLNKGSIIAKKDDTSLKFMSMRNFLTKPKKLASLIDSQVLLTDKINDAIFPIAKTEKQEKEGEIFYIIKKLKDDEKNKKFIANFIKHLEKK